jgi:glycosyltransferase family protein
MLKKIQKELERFKTRLFYSGKKHKQLEEMQYKLDNIPYEIYDKIISDNFHIQMPTIKSIDETLDKIVQDKCSISRFGDGEFGVMFGSRIRYHDRSSKLVQRLKEVISSENPKLLIGLPPCFGSLDDFIPPTINFWRKWMSKKRAMVYSYLDMNRIYYNAFINRCYLNYNKTDEHHQACRRYFGRLKEIWKDRDIILFESQQGRLGVGNDLLEEAKSISRIVFCPVKNAFDKYDEILSAFDGLNSDVLILAALGPTATVLAYDLCNEGYQAIDIGHLDLEYEWFLRKDELGKPLEFKYVDGTSEGRKIHRLQDPKYKRQIMKTIV